MIYRARFADRAERPWKAKLRSPGKDKRYRQITFGQDGRGILQFSIIDDAELIQIHRIIWMD